MSPGQFTGHLPQGMHHQPHLGYPHLAHPHHSHLHQSQNVPSFFPNFYAPPQVLATNPPGSTEKDDKGESGKKHQQMLNSNIYVTKYPGMTVYGATGLGQPQP